MHRNPVIALALAVAGALAAAGAAGEAASTPRPLAPLPELAKQPDPAQVALGRLLFQDVRLSGDGSTSCATCHDPQQHYADGLALAKGYPGALYFRNTPTVINAVHGGYLYWDGRLPASDLPTLVRDHISEAHFMQADGRLVLERLRQVPHYERGFKEAAGGEPTYGRILNVVTAYVTTLRSRNVPFDRHLAGEKGALPPEAGRGLALFQGKAGCVRCHDGPMLSDGGFHDLGLATSRDVFRKPERSIVFRNFCKTLGVPGFETLREDPGLYAISKDRADLGHFRTPTLREVSRTAPYMHDGSLPTLEAVVDLYDAGGGPRSGKDPLLAPLGLAPEEKAALVAFLGTLAGDPVADEWLELPPYEPRRLGEN